MSFYTLIEQFHQRSIFWPPESFTLNRSVDERVFEWCETVLFKNEQLLALVKQQVPCKMDSVLILITRKSSALLTKCILQYWLALVDEELQRYAKLMSSASWIRNCLVPASDSVNERQLSVYDDGETVSVDFTISLNDIPSMKQEELLYWKYKLIVFAAQCDDVILYNSSRKLLQEIESRLL